MEYMTVPFEVKQFDAENDDGYFKFQGYASTFGNVDLGDDRVIKGAFAGCIARMRDSGKRLPVLWQHDMYEPLGVYTEMREDEKGLFVSGRMPKDDTFVSGRVVPQMKAGSITSMSIGYVATDFEITRNVRDLKEIDLREISLVTMPMNPRAIITDVKGAVPFGDLPLADTDRKWDSDAAIARVRGLTGEDEPGARYRRAFFWYDADSADEWGAYKLPFADVIDGRLTAVPRGVFAAAAAIRGARGGVDLPDADRAAVIRNIERYYAKMDRDSPFKAVPVSYITTVDIKDLTTRDLDKALRSGVKFSLNATKRFLSCLDAGKLRDVADGTRDAEKQVLDRLTEIKIINTIKETLNVRKS